MSKRITADDFKDKTNNRANYWGSQPVVPALIYGDIEETFKIGSDSDC